MGRLSLRQLLIVLVAAIWQAGCATTAEPEPLWAEARVPIRAQITSSGFQQRIVPWDALVLESNAPIEQIENADLSPGVREAAARLKAREAALEDLTVRLGQLAAAEPLPGERDRLNVSEFAERHPAVESAIAESFDSGWTEEVRRDRQGRAVLAVKLPLEKIAEAVLLRGGGFSPESEIGRTLGARSLAQKKALEEARKALAEKFVALPLSGKTTVLDWLADPVVAEEAASAVKGARVLRSEEVQSSEQPAWLIELELEPDAVLQRIRVRVWDLEEKNTKKDAQ